MNESWEDIDDEPLQFDVLSYISKIFLFLLPIFALLMKCFYWKRLYINHLILVLHNHSLMLLSFIFIFMISMLFNLNEEIIAVLSLSILLLLGIYIFISAYKFYNTRKIITLIKFLPLSIIYFIILLSCNFVMARLFYSFPNIFS